jgi:hypothetical protein
MVKRIINYIKSGRTKEALEVALCLCLRHNVQKVYNDLILASNRLHRADKDCLAGIISVAERNITYVFITSLIQESLPELKKKRLLKFFPQQTIAQNSKERAPGIRVTVKERSVWAIPRPYSSLAPSAASWPLLSAVCSFHW